MKPSAPENTLPTARGADWQELPAGHLPAPTFWPAALGLGTTCIFWGLITSWVVLTVGIVVFFGALAGWIVDICHERRDPHA